MMGDPEGQEDQRAGGGKKAEAPPGFEPTITGDGQKSAGYTAKGDDHPPQSKPWWKLVPRIQFTDWAIVLLTAVIAYSTWSSDQTFQRQLVEMRSASAQTEHAIETSIQNGATVAYQAALTARALKIAETNSKTSTRQLTTARDTEIRDLRAYVDVHQAKDENGRAIPMIYSLGNPKRPMYAAVSIRNDGKSPAHDLAVWASLSVLDAHFANDVSPVFYEVRRDEGQRLSVGDVVSFTQHLDPITQDQRIGLKNGTMYLFFTMTIKYKDTFSQNHRTRFCVWFLPGSTLDSVCRGHNDSD